jgi:hypothetical protein
VELTAVAERGAITQRTPSSERRAFGRLAREVPADPRFPLAEERGDMRFGSRPAAPVRTGNGDDNAPGWIEDDPQGPRLGRATEDVAEAAAGEDDRGRLLRDDPAGGWARHRAR